jgi:hypothetical protein
MLRQCSVSSLIWGRSDMATWHDLSLEIHDIILYWFCMIIVGEYAQTNEDGFNLEPVDDEPGFSESLLSFSSALQTSSSFRYALTETVKMNKKSVAETLQSMQFTHLENLVTKMHVRFITQGCHFEIGVLKRMTGSFWINPKFVEDFNIISTILFFSSEEETIFLLPRLRCWSLQHARLASNTNNTITVLANDGGYQYSLKRGMYEIKGNSIELLSIAGVAGNEDQQTSHAILRDIARAPADTWWAFRRISDPGAWFMVKYDS